MWLLQPRARVVRRSPRIKWRWGERVNYTLTRCKATCILSESISLLKSVDSNTVLLNKQINSPPFGFICQHFEILPVKKLTEQLSLKKIVDRCSQGSRTLFLDRHTDDDVFKYKKNFSK